MGELDFLKKKTFCFLDIEGSGVKKSLKTTWFVNDPYIHFVPYLIELFSSFELELHFAFSFAQYHHEQVKIHIEIWLRLEISSFRSTAPVPLVVFAIGIHLKNRRKVFLKSEHLQLLLLI